MASHPASLVVCFFRKRAVVRAAKLRNGWIRATSTLEKVWLECNPSLPPRSHSRVTSIFKLWSIQNFHVVSSAGMVYTK